MLESSSLKESGEPTLADYQKFKAACDPPEGGELVLSLVPRSRIFIEGKATAKIADIYVVREK